MSVRDLLLTTNPGEPVPWSKLNAVSLKVKDLTVTGSATGIGGIQSLNGLTAPVQTMVVGSGGTNFNINSTGSVHTFNIPDASSTARGLINTGTQSLIGNKTFSGSCLFSSITGPTGFITSTGWIAGYFRSILAPGRAVVAGCLAVSGESQPTIGAHTVALSAWAPLWLNGGAMPTIVGAYTEAQMAGYLFGVNGNVRIGGNINGISLPATGGTFAKLSDIPTVMTPSYIGVYYDNYPFNLYGPNVIIPIGTTTSTSAGMSVSSDAIFLPGGSGNKYSVTVSIPCYKESSIQLFDGNNSAIPGTILAGGDPVIDVMTSVLSATFTISQPALDKFTIRGSGVTGAYVGKASASTNPVTLSVSVNRIA